MHPPHCPYLGNASALRASKGVHNKLHLLMTKILPPNIKKDIFHFSCVTCKKQSCNSYLFLKIKPLDKLIPLCPGLPAIHCPAQSLLLPALYSANNSFTSTFYCSGLGGGAGLCVEAQTTMNKFTT